jgi:hypothetical protein
MFNRRMLIKKRNKELKGFKIYLLHFSPLLFTASVPFSLPYIASVTVDSWYNREVKGSK